MFDVEQFIIEVRNRTVLWDQNHAEYNQRHSKLGAWEDVAANMYVDWGDLSNYDKFGKVRDIQARWKNIRDNYMKELKYEKKVEKGLALPKKNKYKYSHLLQFLTGEKRKSRGSDQSTTDIEDSGDNKEELKQNNSKSDLSSSPSVALGSSNNQVKLSGNKRAKRFKQNSNISMQLKLQSDSSTIDSDSNNQTVDKGRVRLSQNHGGNEMTQQRNNSMDLDCSSNIQKSQNIGMENEVLQDYFNGDVTHKVNSDYLSPSVEIHSGFSSLPLEQDDDKMFLLSLLPYFKRLNEERRLQARIEMSTILQKMIYKKS